MSKIKDKIFEDRLIFLLKFRKFIPSSHFIQYLFIISKFIPLLMISHDLGIHTGYYVNYLLSFLTIVRIFDIRGSSTITTIIFFLIAFLIIYFFYYIKMFYKKIEFKNDPLAEIKPSKYFKNILSVFIFIFVFLNQNIYEICFTFFLCEGVNTVNSPLTSLNTDCYTGLRFLIIALAIIILLFLIIVNLIFNMVFFQPWFSSDCIIPTMFNGNNSIWTILPLVQGYVMIEKNLPDNYILTIRYILRALFLIYSFQFYFRIDKFRAVHKKVFFIIYFLNTFCFVSILIEFIPYISSQLNDINFVIVKILIELSISVIVIFFISSKEKKSLLNFKNWKKSPNFYELFSRFLYLMLNFDQSNNNVHDFEVIINQYFEYEIINSEQDNSLHGGDFAERGTKNNKNIVEVYSKTKSFFKILKGVHIVEDINPKSKHDKKKAAEYEMLSKDKNKFILSKLIFYVNQLDETFLQNIADERGNEISKFKSILIYCLFCNSIKRNYVSAFFYLEKLSFTRMYQNSFTIRLYYAQIKKMICKDYFNVRIADNKEKRDIKKFYDSIKDFDNLLLNLKNSVDALKDMTVGVNADGVNLLQFTNTMLIVEKSLRVVSTKENKNLRGVLSTLNNTEENNALISKYVVFNDLVDKDKEVTEKSLFGKETINPNEDTNDKYAMTYLDENQDIFILKLEKKLQTMLGYENVDVKDTNLLVVIPASIGKYHKKITTSFTSSNKDFRKIDLFFITRDKFNIPFTATLIIFPMFDGRIIFFVMADLFNKDMNLNLNNPLQLPSSSFKCFTELSNECEIVSVNKEFERVFGINREVLSCPSGKFNFMSKVLNILPDKVFNRTDHVQHYEARIPFVTIFENIKKLNYDEFREYSLEAYYKLKSFFTNFNLKRYPNVVMIIFIERRIIDKVDNDFFYYVVLTIERPKRLVSAKTEMRQSIIDAAKSSNDDIERLKKEKKLMMLTQEINVMSKKMLEEGSRLWNGAIKYSDVTDLTSIDKLMGFFEKDAPGDQASTKGKEKEKIDIQILSDNNEFNIFAKDSSSSLFKIKNFIFFIALSLFLILFYAITFTYISNEYNIALKINRLNSNILSVKYSQVMTSFLLTEKFLINGNLFPNSTNDIVSSPPDLEFYIDDLNQNVYDFQQAFSSISNDNRYNSSAIYELINTMKIYKSIASDFSIYMRNFTFYDSIDIFRLKVENYDFFDNLTFSKYPSEFSQNNLIFDINKKDYLSKTASQGDLLIYLLINNFIDITIPLCDRIIAENKLILSSFTNGLVKFEFIFFCILIICLITFFIYLYDYFYSGKKYIYERYFVMFNIIKFFTPYLLQKLKSYDELMSNYNKEKYEYFLKLDFDVNTENLNSSLIRFEKDNNNIIVFSAAQKNLGFERKSSLFASGMGLKTLGTNTIGPNEFLSKKTLMKKATLRDKNKIAENEKADVQTPERINPFRKMLMKKATLRDKEKIAQNEKLDLEEEIQNQKVSTPKKSPLKNFLKFSNKDNEQEGKKLKSSSFAKKILQFSNEENGEEISGTPSTPKIKSLKFTNRDNTNTNPSSNASRVLNSKNNLLTQETENRAAKRLLSLNNLMKTKKEETKKKHEEEEEEDVNDSAINPKNLLVAKNSYYFDFYFLLTIVTLFLILNLIFFFIMYTYTQDVVSICDYTFMTVNLSYSQIEISLVYIVTLLKEKEILNYDQNSIFQDKVQNFNTEKNSIFVSNSKLTEVMAYESQMFTNNACQSIVSNYVTLFTNNNVLSSQDCQAMAGAIYKNGIVLGFESTVNNLVNSYNEKQKNSFKIANANTGSKYQLYNDDLKTVFSTRKDVLEKNIENTKQLINIGTTRIENDSQSYLKLYYILFFLLFVMLVLSYCFIYLFTKQSYVLLTKMENVLNNLLR